MKPQWNFHFYTNFETSAGNKKRFVAYILVFFIFLSMRIIQDFRRNLVFGFTLILFQCHSILAVCLQENKIEAIVSCRGISGTGKVASTFYAKYTFQFNLTSIDN